MHTRGRQLAVRVMGLLGALAIAGSAVAQAPAQRPRFPVPQGPRVTSPEVAADGRVTIGASHLGTFAYVGVFSSGVFGITGSGPGSGGPGPSFEEQHRDVLDDAGKKKGLALVWFATGKDDFVLETSRATVEMLRKHGFDVVCKESPGGHTWINWRNYLDEFAPKLFH
jgi:enterochelin esterase-like enzyme